MDSGEVMQYNWNRISLLDKKSRLSDKQKSEKEMRIEFQNAFATVPMEKIQDVVSVVRKSLTEEVIDSVDDFLAEFEEVYLRPVCPRCGSEYLSWFMASGNGLVCLECGKTFFLVEGNPKKDIRHEEDVKED